MDLLRGDPARYDAPDSEVNNLIITYSVVYRSTSLKRNCFPLGPYSKPMPRALWWS